MKVAENCSYWGTDVAKLMIERRVLEMNGESEFLVGLHYAFQTRQTVHLITDFFRGGDMAQLTCNTAQIAHEFYTAKTTFS
jgi:hypothetical protein